MKRLLLIALVATLVACSGKPTPPPIVVEPEDTADCGDACAHLLKLGCEEGKSLGDGTTCKAWCEETQRKGHALRPSCVLGITTCAELEPKCAKPRQTVPPTSSVSDSAGGTL